MLLLVWGKEEVNVFYSVDNILEALCAFLRTASHWLQYPSVIPLTTRLRPCSSDLRNDWLLCKARCPISVKEGGPFPVEQALAPTVVESNVPERTRRRGEYSARVCGREITVSFFCPPSPLKQQEQTKPDFRGVSQSLLIIRRRETRSRKFFFSFFVFFLFSLKEDSVLRGGLFSALAAKMMVGEVEVKERPRPSPDYLMQLLNEKKLMTSLPNLCGIFTHLERLLDEGKWPSGETPSSLERWGSGLKHDHGAVRCRHGFAGHPCRKSLAKPGDTLAEGTPIFQAVAGVVVPTSSENCPTIQPKKRTSILPERVCFSLSSESTGVFCCSLDFVTTR